MSELQVLRIEDVVALLRVSRPTVDRWVQESREGKNDFPLPFSAKGRRVLWTADVIQNWIQSKQSAATPPVNVPTTRQRKKAEGVTIFPRSPFLFFVFKVLDWLIRIL
jgi:predicted DNA-binding transcriptional regulator AlpA